MRRPKPLKNGKEYVSIPSPFGAVEQLSEGGGFSGPGSRVGFNPLSIRGCRTTSMCLYLVAILDAQFQSPLHSGLSNNERDCLICKDAEQEVSIPSPFGAVE